MKQMKPDKNNSNLQNLRLACVCLLRCKQNDFSVVIGIKCSSFCKMNLGTSRRAPCASIGYTAYRSVREANLLLERPAGKP